LKYLTDLKERFFKQMGVESPILFGRFIERRWKRSDHAVKWGLEEGYRIIGHCFPSTKNEEGVVRDNG